MEKIILGDILNKALIDENLVDLTITSPPYNVGIEYLKTMIILLIISI